ncbi:hypothetical protein ABI59_15620 [Acidobacteria bacterium Mor1]|nr:hypothetical protein ABI59_15620 [Acidobacteria bacterium Mor1]
MRLTLMALFVCALIGSPLFADAPDSEVNPQTGDIETADATTNASDLDVRITIDDGSGNNVVTFLSTHADDDRAPRISIEDSGDVWVIWWRDSATDEIVLRKRPHGSTWDAEQVISEPGESSRNPSIVSDGSDVFMAYEYDSGSDTGIAVYQEEWQPDPYGIRLTLDTTSYGGDVDVLLFSEDGNVWVTWVDSAGDVAWSEYDAAGDSWSATAYESYSADTVEDARSRIRTTVLAP